MSSDTVWLLLSSSQNAGPCKAEYSEVVALPDLEEYLNDNETATDVTEHLHIDLVESCIDR